jgi:type II secretory ATPase GspE/PulE/Tfp pilus assembly ATPase PilB-like protein/8-oxo-dGTP pyrophosphatase MutT (NUDIX family)
VVAPLLDVERLTSADRHSRSLREAVVSQGVLTEQELDAAIAAQLRLPLADLSRVHTQALELIPERWARKFSVVPLNLEDNALVVATSNPCDIDCERTLAFAAGRDVRFAVAAPSAIAARLDEVYPGDGTASLDSTLHAPAERTLDVQVITGDQDHFAPDDELPDDSEAITRLVDDLLGDGVDSGASDIHIEPEEQAIAVRHRIDGVMRLARRLPRAIAPALVSRIKIVSGLDIADRLRPQDGRARVAVNGVAVDLRISTLPASHGEKVVIRVLDSRSSVLTLEAMGFGADDFARIERLLQAREGLILVTGPTGSGKTTTLYAALRRLKQRAVNIVTVEDPIEYRLPGIVQVQVRERAGLTFAAALRSIMRQDPDVLLIGEIRDRETADIAIQASLTGHLVLSTLHTNDAASAVTRLIDIGIAPYKIATAVKGVIAQRLVRRLCSLCRRARGPVSVDQAVAAPAEPHEEFVAGGCEACAGTGYRGRLALVEVLIGTPDFERRVALGEPAERIAEAARLDGMGSLWTSGVAHVRAGDTSLEELLRVVAPVDAEPSTHYLPQRSSESDRSAERAVAEIQIGSIDLYVVRPLPSGWRVLVLQRALDTRCPGAWESVHGRLEPGEEPEDAAIRELREEAGLTVERLYNVTVQPFYLHRSHTIHMAVVFAAFVAEPGEVTLGPEHQRAEWLPLEEAVERFQWPREKAAMRDVVQLLGAGDAGPVEDVLRVR